MDDIRSESISSWNPCLLICGAFDRIQFLIRLTSEPRLAALMSTLSSALMGQVFLRKLFALAGNSLLVYDYLITLSLEVTYIWDAPWTLVRAGFFINRYGNLVGQMYILLEEMGYLAHDSQKFCVGFRIYCSLLVVFSGESIRILVLMRAWAVWGCKRGIAIFLISVYSVYILGACIMTAYATVKTPPQKFEYVEELGLCHAPAPAGVWMFWFATLSLDAFALAMVYFSLSRLAKESQSPHASPLIRLLVRDAFLFYAMNLFNGVFSTICWTIWREDPRNLLQTLFTFPLISILGQRLVLNLRGLRVQQNSMRNWSREIDRQIIMIDNRERLRSRENEIMEL